MEKLKVGVIGAGYLGRFHAEKYARMEDVDLVAVVDTDEAAARRTAEKCAAAAASDYRTLFGQVDAVSIVVPTSLHFSISRDFLENGIDVLIEKPMTASLEEADELIHIAESRGLLIQVGHLERFNPAVLALEGEAATPLFIESNRLSVYQPRGTDVSVVLDLMIHDIDIILNLVRAETIDIRAAGLPVIGNQVDIANARLAFAGGAVANVTASRVSLKNERTLRLYQRDALFAVDFAGRSITVIRPGDPPDNDCPIPGMKMTQRRFDESDALEDELRSFVRSVQNRREPEVTGKMGRDALRVALSVMAQIDAHPRG
ncbi:MAG: Gfo/Idh/MocA family oxidoreductase [Desulfobacterales bacterium]|nr:Gfo/Idh/MocA family oxidoreductase [Desulfobacterales bacterium]